MGELQITPGQQLIGALHGAKGDMVLPKPFEKEIFLCEGRVAGTSHVPGMKELEPHLKIGERLSLFREAGNSYDDMAILVKTENGMKIGYVPREGNQILARLLDAGKVLFGKITQKELKGNWVKIQIDIYMQD